MRKIVSAFLLFSVISFLHAQTPFEGTIKWTLSINMPGTKNGSVELTAKQQAELKDGIAQLEKQLNDPNMKAAFESNPSLKATLETQLQAMKSMQGASGANSLMPKGCSIKTKNGNSLTTIDGGMANTAGDILYIKSVDKTYSIKHAEKTYSVIPASTKTATEQSAVTVTPTTETKKILSYTCTKYNVTLIHNNVTHTMQIWVTKELKQYDSKSFHSGGLGQDQTAEALKKIDGVPLRIEASEKGGEIIMEVVQISPEKLSDYLFILPSGYKEVPYTK